MRYTELPKTTDEWYQLGFDEQEWGYPLLDHVWKKRTIFNWYPKYPKKYQNAYRLGQWRAYEEGKSSRGEKPYFEKPKQR